jgi:hypothetical protein
MAFIKIDYNRNEFLYLPSKIPEVQVQVVAQESNWNLWYNN